MQDAEGPAQVDNEAELAGKAWCIRDGERIGQRIGNRNVRIMIRVAEKVRTDGIHEDVPPRFVFGILIDQIERHQFGDQVGVRFRCDAANVDIGAVRQAKIAVAMADRGRCQPFCLRSGQAVVARADPHHEAVARHHRAQGTGAPALDDRGAHRAAPMAVELRRVTQSPASRSAAKRSRSAASAPGFSRSMKATRSSRPSVASW